MHKRPSGAKSPAHGTQQLKNSTLKLPKLTLKQRKQCHRRCRRNAEPRACRQRCAAQLSKTGTVASCCTAQWARCMACQNQMTVTAYCARYPETRGCPNAPALGNCCLEDTAECIACQTQETLAEVCEKNVARVGCEAFRRRTACAAQCEAETSKDCMATCLQGPLTTENGDPDGG